MRHGSSPPGRWSFRQIRSPGRPAYPSLQSRYQKNAPYLKRPIRCSLVFPSRAGDLCNQCFAKARAPNKLLCCASCKSAWYCSASCQKTAWELCRHKFECTIAGDVAAQCKFMPEIAQQDLRILLRVALIRMSPGMDAPEAPGGFVPRFEEVLRMPGHEEETERADPDRMEGNHMLSRLALQLLDSPRLRKKKGLEWALLPSLKELTRVLCCLACNDFSIWDELLLPLGLGVFPLGALLNHSCEPNCVLYYAPDSHTQVIRAIRAVPAGEELCHAYIDIAAPTADRRSKLASGYHFRCSCPRCQAGALDARLGSAGGSDRESAAHWRYLQGAVALAEAEDTQQLRRACDTSGPAPGPAPGPSRRRAARRASKAGARRQAAGGGT